MQAFNEVGLDRPQPVPDNDGELEKPSVFSNIKVCIEVRCTNGCKLDVTIFFDSTSGAAVPGTDQVRSGNCASDSDGVTLAPALAYLPKLGISLQQGCQYVTGKTNFGALGMPC
eukprot:1157534-Pelagomonas_calceolata.AAC.3